MQSIKARRSNRDRTETTRRDLIAAARTLFTEKSYAETGTPDIVAAAGVTRGALYHHFADKQALLRAVLEQEASDLAAEIETASGPHENMPPREALMSGADAYFKSMAKSGRTRLLLLDGPAVLGRATMDEIDARHGNRTLREGLLAMMDAGQMKSLPVDALTQLLGAAFDRAALSIETGATADDYTETLAALIDGIVTDRN